MLSTLPYTLVKRRVWRQFMKLEVS